MFMEIAIGAIGIAIVLMIGYLVVAQVRGSMTTTLSGLPADVSGNVTAGLNNTQTIVFAGFALLAVGVIVLAAFGIISVFK